MKPKKNLTTKQTLLLLSQVSSQLADRLEDMQIALEDLQRASVTMATIKQQNVQIHTAVNEMREMVKAIAGAVAQMPVPKSHPAHPCHDGHKGPFNRFRNTRSVDYVCQACGKGVAIQMPEESNA